MTHPFEIELSERVWEQRYRHRRDDRPVDRTLADSWRRVARAAASMERTAAQAHEESFFALLQDFHFLPGGRILAGAGTALHATLLNCFVMGAIEDSMDGIFGALKESALTMQQGGGIGCDFSTLRPRGTRARATGNVASGPVSFMRVWDAACGTITGSGPRGGAMMATLRCDHPDLLEFIDAKRDGRELHRFNLSVQITDDFLDAVAQDREWPLVFPCSALAAAHAMPTVTRPWTDGKPVPCAVLRTLPARDLWQRLTRAAVECGDPGVVFVDTINRENTLHYDEYLTATNPCGELPLPPYGACDLGSLNLVKFVEAPFSSAAQLNLEALGAAAKTAVRFLDDILDASRYPLAAQRERSLRSRRIGLGMTGLADALIMLGLRYDDERARRVAANAAECLRDAAYAASIELAREKGAFPAFRCDAFLDGAFVRRLPAALRDRIAAHGLRNGQLLAIAPTGSISLLANDVSSGIEPVFAFEGSRRLRTVDGWRSCRTTDYAWRRWQERWGSTAPLGEAFVTAWQLAPAAHLAMQAALQPFVDGAIAKTVNLPADYPIERCGEIFESAHRLALKGCTVFRPNRVTGSVLSAQAGPVGAALADARQCCLGT